MSYTGDVSYSDSMGGQAIDTIPSNAPTGLNASVLSGNLVRLDFLNRGDDHQPMRKIMRRLFAPLLVDREVDPRTYKSMEELSAAVQQGLQAGYWKAPPHRVFLDRVLLGIDGYLKLSGTVANWHRIYKKWVYAEPRDFTSLVKVRSRHAKHP